MKAISARRLWVARGLAVAVDAIQFGLAPISAEGVFSPISDGLDMVMCGLMTWMLGWHLAFLPTIAMKLVPVVDLAPCWTIAVLIATRRSQRMPEVTTDVPPVMTTQRPPMIEMPRKLPEKSDGNAGG